MDFKLSKNNLNLRVYTATGTPATGMENDIAIITTTPMKNWVMSPDAPRGIPRRDGDVWLRYSVEGDAINVVKSGSLMICPGTAYQYIDGAWEEKTFQIYRDGEWIGGTPVGLLYFEGNECTTTTGGWSASAEEIGAITENKDSVTIKVTEYKQGTTAYCTENKIDISGFNTLKIKIDAYSSAEASSTMTFGVAKSRPSGAYPDFNSAVKKLGNIAATGEFSLDISDVTEPVYVYFGSSYSYTYTATVSKIWLE